MMKILSRLPPAMRLAISITLLVLSIVSVAMAIGLLPDRLTVQLQERARMAEALTIQLASFAAEGELAAMQRSLAGIEQRDPEILSIAIRDPGSGMVVETTGHQEFWKDARPDRSTSTHVRVPIVSGEKDWGTVEIVFAPLQGGIPLLGLPSDLLRFAGFLAAGCLFGVFTVLHMALRQLDPSRSVPTRVQNAFDSLSDGIAIVDEADTILLVNQQLAAILGGEPKEYLGKALSKLMWRHWSQDGAGDAFPWTLALKHGDGVRDVPMNLRSNSGGLVNVLVNASCIPSDSGRVAGALVTFKDVTVLERKNMDLSLAYTRLKESEHEIKRQNNQLRYLASHDPLTSCLNRRSMSEAFAQKLEAARQNGRALTCLMVDIDHFKKINDTYGHSTGDDVIAGMGKLLRDNCGSDDLVGRYGGEEFCVALDGIDIEGATVLAERLRQETRQRGPDWLKRDGVVTVSIGIAAVDTETVGEAVDHADQALYVAKRTGRDRAVRWHRGLSDSTAPAAAASEPHAASAVAAAALPLPAAPAALASLTANRQRSMLELDSLLGRVSDSISRARRDSKAVAVICVSIDSLEEFADAFGPQAAGELANAIEGRLSAIFRDSDTVALMSGNERPVALGNVRGSRFLIEVSGIDDNTSIVWILQRLAQRMETPFGPASHDIPVRFSIGASLYPQDGKDANEVVQNAILAQKRALDAGGDRAYRMFSSDMFEMVREQLLVEKGIREAIANNEFHIRFQPIVNLVESKVSGAEVLLRSSNSTLQNTPIGLVIQVAERTGLIHAISHCVFSSAFSTLREWRRNGIELPLISINLSAKQLQDKAIIMTLIELVEQNGIEPASIQLEMTETAMVKDMAETSRILQALQSYGFHIALDDFGTGGSSLSHLIDIKPDAIKIDRSFIQALSRKHTNDILVSMITELSQRIGAKVIAEGVETTDQLEALIGIGCHYVQGYLFSRPLPAEAFRDWLIMASREEERPAPSRESRPRIADRTGSAGVMRRAG